jgi:hypothetical protein
MPLKRDVFWVKPFMTPGADYTWENQVANWPVPGWLKVEVTEFNGKVKMATPNLGRRIKRETCPNCKGSGSYDGSACVRCGASGKVTSDDRPKDG